jgi:hypothetical protein
VSTDQQANMHPLDASGENVGKAELRIIAIEMKAQRATMSRPSL